MRVRKGCLVFLVFFLLSSSLLVSPLMAEDLKLQQLLEQAHMLSLNKEAIDFTLPDLKGNNVSLSDYRGKVILLNFWTTWCPNCRRERPYLEGLYQKIKDRDFVLLAINIKESREDTGKFVNEHNLNFLHLLDREGMVSRKYGVIAIPTSFIIDREGLVVGKIIGLRDWTDKEIMALFEYLLKE